MLEWEQFKLNVSNPESACPRNIPEPPRDPRHPEPVVCPAGDIDEAHLFVLVLVAWAPAHPMEDAVFVPVALW